MSDVLQPSNRQRVWELRRQGYSLDRTRRLLIEEGRGTWTRERVRQMEANYERTHSINAALSLADALASAVEALEVPFMKPTPAEAMAEINERMGSVRRALREYREARR